MLRQRVVAVAIVVLALVAFAIALTRPGAVPEARGQITPGPPTTPQPTVPCTPPGLPSGNPGGVGCGRGPGIQRDVGYAWIDRYCNGDAVPTPPGFTTFALNYGLGGQSLSPAQFFGVLMVNGVEVPSAPLNLLQPGQKDVRIRTAVIPSDAVITVTLTGTSVNTGQPLIFGNGQTTRVRTASGPCPGVPTLQSVPPPAAPPVATTPGAPPPAAPGAPPVNTLPPGNTFPPAL